MERKNDTYEMQAEQTRALSPQEIMELKQEMTPAVVLDTVNRLLAENLRQGGFATIKQKDIVAALEQQGLERTEIYAKHWLDFENLYREAGWEVAYDSPGFNETYDASFEFRPRKTNLLGEEAVRRSINEL